MSEQEAEEEVWVPKTQLGKRVAKGELTTVQEALHADEKVMEPEIIDQLIDLDEEVILIGGTPGKGGGKRRTVSKRTARMHKSGARYRSKAMTVLGDRNSVIGLGHGEAEDTRAAIESASREAKLNLIEIDKGCGSWECACGTEHTVPFEVTGKSGSVEVELKPAPKGIGLAASDDMAKLLELAGFEDVWVQSRGKTRTRGNLIRAGFNALEKINEMKRGEE